MNEEKHVCCGLACEGENTPATIYAHGDYWCTSCVEHARKHVSEMWDGSDQCGYSDCPFCYGRKA